MIVSITSLLLSRLVYHYSQCADTIMNVSIFPRVRYRLFGPFSWRRLIEISKVFMNYYFTIFLIRRQVTSRKCDSDFTFGSKLTLCHLISHVAWDWGRMYFRRKITSTSLSVRFLKAFLLSNVCNASFPRC